MRNPLAPAALLLALAAAASAAPAKSQSEFLFPWDLGPAEIDVSRYPAEQRARYELFLKTCSQCHTAARAINAPFVGRRNWKGFVDRMHVLGGDRPGAAFSEADAEAILEFLVFDSRERKLKRRESFEARSRRLKALFDEIRRERLRED